MAGNASRQNGKKGGRPKGEATLSKELAREALRQIIIREMPALVSAQLSNAKGIKYLVVREKRSGKFLRVGELRARSVKDDEEIVEVWEKDPCVQAFTDLMNRALDKPKEQEQTINLDVNLNVVDILQRRFKTKS